MLSALFMAVLSSPAEARETPHWWLVRDKVAIGTTAREPVSSPEATCADLSRADLKTCSELIEKSNALLAEDRKLQADLHGTGVVFAHGGLMLIGGTSQGYGDILINAEPPEFE